MSIETISSFTDTAATTEFFGDLLGAFISQNKASAWSIEFVPWYLIVKS